jgi:hypothetical protein
MNTQDKGKCLQDIDLVEGMTLICTDDADYSHIYTVDKEYEVSTYLGKLGFIGDNKFHYPSSSSLFIIKEQTLSFANTKIDLRDAEGNVDEEKSIAFQEACFKEGYRWCSGEKTVQFTNKPFLYQNDYATLGFGSCNGFFSESLLTEITFEYERKLEYNIALKVVDTVDGKLSEKEVKLNKVISDLEEQLVKAKKALEGV